MGLFGDEKRGAWGGERGAESGGREPASGVAVVLRDSLCTSGSCYVLRSTPRSTLPAATAVTKSLHSRRSTLRSWTASTPEQRAAVLCTDAPLVIVAGPGTGKTRTLTVRIAHLILEKGVAPENILAITFTNKAAGEMRERLSRLLGDEIAGRVTIKTFHAFGAMLLRQHAERLGLSPEFVILAEEDRAALLRQACPELKQGEVDAALAQISAAKNEAYG